MQSDFSFFNHIILFICSISYSYILIIYAFNIIYFLSFSKNCISLCFCAIPIPFLSIRFIFNVTKDRGECGGGGLDQLGISKWRESTHVIWWCSKDSEWPVSRPSTPLKIVSMISRQKKVN